MKTNRLTLEELTEMRRMREKYLAQQAAASKDDAAVQSASFEDVYVSGDGCHVDSSTDIVRENPILPDDMLPVRTGLLPGYRPNESELLRYHRKWDGLQTYVEHENALVMLFRELPEFKGNTSLRHVIVKCSVLNDFYATNIFQIEPVARNIISIRDFDERVKAGDSQLVDEIADIENFPRVYSFATKYCAHHNPAAYPIYDRYVDEVLNYLCRQYPGVMPFRHRSSLKDYSVFKAAIGTVQREFGLQDYSFKDIDRYLWQLGKDYYNPYVKKQ